MVQALAGSVLGAFGNQSKRVVDRQPIPSAVAVIGAAKDNKTAKRISKEADKERLYALLTQPEVLGLLLTFGGVVAANKIPFSSDPAENDLLQGIMTTASVVMGCGYAGVGDLTSLSLAIAAGGASVLGSLVGDAVDDVGGAINPFNWKWPLGPIWNW